MKLSPMLLTLLNKLNDLPHACQIYVFGSVAKNGDCPGDLDVALAVPECRNWNDAMAKYADTIRPMRALAYQYYGSLDPFVSTATVLAVRNDEATSWMPAKSSKALKTAIRDDGVLLSEIIAKLNLAPILNDESFGI